MNVVAFHSHSSFRVGMSLFGKKKGQNHSLEDEIGLRSALRCAEYTSLPGSERQQQWEAWKQTALFFFLLRGENCD